MSDHKSTIRPFLRNRKFQIKLAYIAILLVNSVSFAQQSIHNAQRDQRNSKGNLPEKTKLDQDKIPEADIAQDNALHKKKSLGTKTTSKDENPTDKTPKGENSMSLAPLDEGKAKPISSDPSTKARESLDSKSKIPVGSSLAELSFSGDEGGRTDGSSWSSRELAGKAWSIWYVDPDEKDLNHEAQEAFKAENFTENKIASVAIINMAATAVPNFILEPLIARSQQEYKKTVYVKDYQKKGVRIWGMKDDSSSVLVIDPEGKVVFYHGGKLDKNNIEKMLEATKKMLGLMP